MTRYRANSNILGLQTGEEFESTSERFAKMAERGRLQVIGQDEQLELADNGGDDSDDDTVPE